MEKLNLEKVKIDKGGSGNILICGISERLTTTGKPYCELLLSDGEMKVTAKMWDITKDILQEYEKKVVYMDITLSGYNGKDSYIVRNIESCKGSPDVLEFIRSAPLSAESMYRVILSVVDSSVTGEYAGSLAELTKRIYEKNRAKLLYWSAAEYLHHNYYSGLLYHTYRMVLAAQALADIYTGIDRELLFSATALHDIGKLRELATDELGEAEYTVNGQLFGHLLTGVMMIEKEAEKGFYDREKITCLEHCIASHHGRQEWGAVRLPCIEEATILHIIDLLDARVEMYEKESANMKPGTLSDIQNYGLDKVKVYMPAFKQTSAARSCPGPQ